MNRNPPRLSHKTPMGIALCATPRSGSNLLAEAMAATGVLGVPKEYFNAGARRKYDDPAYPKFPRRQVARILSEGRGPNDVYAFKVFPSQSRKVRRWIDWTKALPNLQFVHLSRRDTLAQAISLSIARQTQAWRAGEDWVKEPIFDPENISNCEAYVRDANAYWGDLFAKKGIEPLRLYYEDISKDLNGTLQMLAQKNGVTLDPGFHFEPRLRVQRSEISSKWRSKYLGLPA